MSQAGGLNSSATENILNSAVLITTNVVVFAGLKLDIYGGKKSKRRFGAGLRLLVGASLSPVPTESANSFVVERIEA